MLKKYQEVLAMPLSFIYICGCNPDHFSPKRVALTIITIMITISLTVKLLWVNLHNIIILSDSMNSLVNSTHCLTYCLSLFINREKVRHLLKKFNYFWDFLGENDFTESFKTAMEIKLRRLKLSIQVFGGYALIVMFSIMAASYLGPEYLILPAFVPNFINYSVFATFDNFTFILGATSVVGADMLIWGSMSLIAIQFEILGKTFVLMDYGGVQPGTIQEKECLEKINFCVKHHNLLLNCCQDLNMIFGTILLIFLAMMIPSMCTLIYITMQGESDYGYIVKSLSLLLGFMMELSLTYCLPAQNLTEQASNIMWSIYDSNWYECKSITIRRSLLMVMIRVQKDTIISAGKTFPINLQTCTKTFKTTLSCYTFMDNMKNTVN